MSMESEDISGISPEALKARLESKNPPFLLDVREVPEYDLVNLGGQNIPMSEFQARMGELPKDREIVVHCHHGMRSAQVVAFLQQNGFSRVLNLTGGIDAWSVQVDQNLLRY
jgi:sulfur-carrier protein adenylyltransferase/sulfurtransferase